MTAEEKAEQLCGMHKQVNKDMQAVHAFFTALERVNVSKELNAPLEYIVECERVIRILEGWVSEEYLPNR